MYVEIARNYVGKNLSEILTRNVDLHIISLNSEKAQIDFSRQNSSELRKNNHSYFIFIHIEKLICVFFHY